jgi:hypothetical protein
VAPPSISRSRAPCLGDLSLPEEGDVVADGGRGYWFYSTSPRRRGIVTSQPRVDSWAHCGSSQTIIFSDARSL